MATAAVPNPATPSAPGSSREITPGSVLAERYRIDERVGAGSTSEVYLAEQVSLRRKVAVKVLHADHPHLAELVARFESEALVAAGIENPNIAGALEVGRLADGSAFFISEHVPGRTLRKELMAAPLSVERSLHIAKQIASVLTDAHELGIYHRDLKPENLMLLRRADDADFVKVLDFGLAQVAAATKPSGKTELVFGTPGYMPPEQALGQPLDGRADLYALGVVLFEMLSGVRPFESASGTLAKQLAGHVPTFAERAPSIKVPPGLEKIIYRLLAASVGERFANADDLIEALNALGSAQAQAAATTTSDRPAARTSAPPPPPLRRTMSGPPPMLERLPPFEAPPPAKPSERPAAANAPVANAAAIANGMDDSDIPTTVSLPRVSPLPPFAPPPGPSVAAATAPPPAKPVERPVTGKPSSSTLATVRARAKNLSGELRGRLGPLGAQLRGKRARVIGGAAAAGLGLSLLAVWALRSPRHAPEAALHVSDRAATPISNSDIAGRDRTAPTTAQQKPATRDAARPSAIQGASDEEAVFLSVADDYARDRREGEAVALVARVLARRPELKDDERVSALLKKTVRADSQQVTDDSFTLITSTLGEKGAELMYSLVLDPMLKDPLRRRVENWLASKDFDRISSSALYSAVKLRNAKTCDQKHALLRLSAEVGGKQTLDLLRDLDAHTICGASDLKNCYPCLAADSRLKDSIQRLEKRLGS
ncbi:MAG TPA: serine/threonine-protein kinase [Polyangiaceae bacterium]|nr:serine/threonine-protein kinase [Polyangiaceae bacterium]